MKQEHIHHNRHPRSPMRELPNEQVCTWHALSFKSACQFTTASHLAQPSLTTSTTNISRTREKSPRASPHLRINTVRHQAEVCCMAQAAQAAQAAWSGDGPGALACWPCLTGDAPNGRVGPTQPSSSHQNRAGRVTWSRGGVRLWAMSRQMCK